MTTPDLPPDKLQLRLQHLSAFLHESNQIRTEWYAYSDAHTDVYGRPHDPQAYRLKAARCDTAAWRAFNRVRYGAEELLASAWAQRRQIGRKKCEPRWAWQLTQLENALHRLHAIQRAWLDTRPTLPSSAKPGTQAYDDLVNFRNSEAWEHLHTWICHGHALLEIHATAQRSLPSASLATLAPAPAPAAAPAASSTTRR